MKSTIANFPHKTLTKAEYCELLIKLIEFTANQLLSNFKAVIRFFESKVISSQANNTVFLTTVIFSLATSLFGSIEWCVKLVLLLSWYNVDNFDLVFFPPKV